MEHGPYSPGGDGDKGDESPMYEQKTEGNHFSQGNNLQFTRLTSLTINHPW